MYIFIYIYQYKHININTYKRFAKYLLILVFKQNIYTRINVYICIRKTINIYKFKTIYIYLLLNKKIRDILKI